MVNQANLQLWIESLRETLVPQTTQTLCRIVEGGDKRAYCCLGWGSELAGVQSFLVQSYGEKEEVTYGMNRNNNLAPYEFMVWLDLVPEDVRQQVEEQGLEAVEDEDMEFDVNLDVPNVFASLLQQGTRERPNTERYSGTPALPTLTFLRTAASMNDAGLSFRQIADVLDYFGVKQD